MVDDVAAARIHPNIPPTSRRRRWAAAVPHEAFAAHDHRGAEDQLREAGGRQALHAHGAGRRGAAGLAESRREIDRRARSKKPPRCSTQWDHETKVDSRGAVLFQMFADKYFGRATATSTRQLRVKFDPEHPVDSAYGLADPSRALAGAGRCRGRMQKDLRLARCPVGRR